MRIATLRVLAGVGTPLILGTSAWAGFTGISAVSKPNEFGILTVNVYAEFDRPGEDHMLAVVGTPDAPLSISVIGGMFYNHPFGTTMAPLGALVEAFPSLAYQTFVTIGVKCAGDPPCQPLDALTIIPGFPGFAGSELSTTVSGWAVTAADPQGDPFNPDYFAGDGRVLIGQFATMNGTAIEGTMLLQYISNGIEGQSAVSFFVPAPSVLWLIGAGSFARRRRNAGKRSPEPFYHAVGSQR